MRLRLVLVEPMYDGNVGSVARAMKNFGFQDLVLVRPCRIGDFGLAMASHARDVLENARVKDSLEEAVKGANLVVGTTGKRLGEEQRHLRLHLRAPYLTPGELASKLRGRDGEVALLLGKEDWGLTNQELMLCDVLVSIPTSESYPIMNLSHAATVLLYELSQGAANGGVDQVKLAKRHSMDLLYGRIDALLEEIRYPEHKRSYAMLIFRRIFGRARITEREANTLMGITKKALWRIDSGGERHR